MRDEQARNEIQSLRKTVKEFANKVGIEITYWHSSSDWVRKEISLIRAERERVAGMKKLGEIAERFDALVEALDFEFEHIPGKLVAKRRAEVENDADAA